MKTAVQEFFNLSLEEKLVYAQQPDGLQGYGQAFVMSDDQKLDWNDMLLIFYYSDISARNMKFWPDDPTSFRINYYPPCCQADKVIGITPHSDGSQMTLLVQVNEVEGLQILKNGNWVPVKPLHDAIVVNIGNVLEGNEILVDKSSQIPIIDMSKLAAGSAEYETEMSKLHQACRDWGFFQVTKDKYCFAEDGAKYKTVKFKDYIKLFLGRRHAGKSTLDDVKIYG
ncbi:OLC1v1031402C1 [Oldenlandia corymbosa var. corymbosa]|uniref:OLC1v1031402C1 n=1 Tax=Oldenlandia corymbosa var. corymbosa TaxID=529605 RepID=A0AAV1CK11_OLDCO|nr:OLC1v1031402C1 [Oldenlandia corymbosa var. corymbosa]